MCQCEPEIIKLKSWLGSELGYGSDSVGNMNRRIDEALKATESNSEQITKHNHTLYGNGQPGLSTRIAILEQWIALKTVSSNNNVSLIIAAFTAVVAVICSVIALFG